MKTPIRAVEKDRREFDTNKVNKVSRTPGLINNAYPHRGGRAGNNLNVFNSTIAFSGRPTMLNKHSMMTSPTACGGDNADLLLE